MGVIEWIAPIPSPVIQGSKVAPPRFIDVTSNAVIVGISFFACLGLVGFIFVGKSAASSLQPAVLAEDPFATAAVVEEREEEESQEKDASTYSMSDLTEVVVRPFQEASSEAVRDGVDDDEFDEFMTRGFEEPHDGISESHFMPESLPHSNASEFSDELFDRGFEEPDDGISNSEQFSALIFETEEEGARSNASSTLDAGTEDPAFLTGFDEPHDGITPLTPIDVAEFHPPRHLEMHSEELDSSTFDHSVMTPPHDQGAAGDRQYDSSTLEASPRDASTLEEERLPEQLPESGESAEDEQLPPDVEVVELFPEGELSVVGGEPAEFVEPPDPDSSTSEEELPEVMPDMEEEFSQRSLPTDIPADYESMEDLSAEPVTDILQDAAERLQPFDRPTNNVLLNEIQNGLQLKRVEQEEKKPSLLGEIRNGIQLKKVEPREKPKPVDNFSALGAAIQMRRGSLHHYSDEESNETHWSSEDLSYHRATLESPQTVSVVADEVEVIQIGESESSEEPLVSQFPEFTEGLKFSGKRQLVPQDAELAEHEPQPYQMEEAEETNSPFPEFPVDRKVAPSQRNLQKFDQFASLRDSAESPQQVEYYQPPAEELGASVMRTPLQISRLRGEDLRQFQEYADMDSPDAQRADYQPLDAELLDHEEESGVSMSLADEQEFPSFDDAEDSDSFQSEEFEVIASPKSLVELESFEREDSASPIAVQEDTSFVLAPIGSTIDGTDASIGAVEHHYADDLEEEEEEEMTPTLPVFKEGSKRTNTQRWRAEKAPFSVVDMFAKDLTDLQEERQEEDSSSNEEDYDSSSDATEESLEDGSSQSAELDTTAEQKDPGSERDVNLQPIGMSLGGLDASNAPVERQSDESAENETTDSEDGYVELNPLGTKFHGINAANGQVEDYTEESTDDMSLSMSRSLEFPPAYLAGLNASSSQVLPVGFSNIFNCEMVELEPIGTIISGTDAGVQELILVQLPEEPSEEQPEIDGEPEEVVDPEVEEESEKEAAATQSASAAELYPPVDVDDLLRGAYTPQAPPETALDLPQPIVSPHSSFDQLEVIELTPVGFTADSLGASLGELEPVFLSEEEDWMEEEDEEGSYNGVPSSPEPLLELPPLQLAQVVPHDASPEPAGRIVDQVSAALSEPQEVPEDFAAGLELLKDDQELYEDLVIENLSSMSTYYAPVTPRMQVTEDDSAMTTYYAPVTPRIQVTEDIDPVHQESFSDSEEQYVV